MNFTLTNNSITFDFDQFLNSEKGINLLGEVLRNHFFDQSKGYGCYSSFDLNKEVEQLPEEPVYFDPNNQAEGIEFTYTCAKRDNIIMKYYWDGDGYLQFTLPSSLKPFSTNSRPSICG